MRLTSVHSLLIVIAFAATLAVGAAMERKFDLFSIPLGLLSTDQTLPELAINSDPGLTNLLSAKPLEDPTAENFGTWQSSTRALILKLGGSEIVPSADRGAQHHRTLQATTLPNGIRQELITFQTFDGSEIPAYLHIPATQQPMPAILVIPGHVREGESGIEQLANAEDSYQHAAARRLAEAGYVTLTPELRGFGYLGQPYHTEHVLVAYNAFLKGTSFKWTILRDLGYAMALLKQLDQVDSSRIGVRGASLGGELSVYYSALDPEVDAVVFQSFGGGQGTKHAQQGGRDDQPHYCHTLPIIDALVSQEQWLWLLAPRPVLGVKGSKNNPFDSSDQALYGTGWSKAGGKIKLELGVAEGGPEFFVEPAVEFFATVFAEKTS